MKSNKHYKEIGTVNQTNLVHITRSFNKVDK